MYFPYFRGKQFELEAILEAPTAIYNNTLPIVEPVNLSTRNLNLFQQINTQGVPLILITNPYHPSRTPLSSADIQSLITTQLAGHTTLSLGFIVDARFSSANLTSFLTSNRRINKVLIFRNDPLPATVTAIQRALSTHTDSYLVFDENKTSALTRASFLSHTAKVLLTDGFQRHDANVHYPNMSTFTSNYSTYTANGWIGIGDYLTVGDHFQEGGGPVYVVALHVTKATSQGVMVHHFVSTTNQTIRGQGPLKFAEANHALVTSSHVRPLRTMGVGYFRNWHSTSHNPSLGAAKKASMINHMEIMSSLV
jgi:hypothetical protein